MDSFTENLLARARQRQKMLEGYGEQETNPFKKGAEHKESMYSEEEIHQETGDSAAEADKQEVDSNILEENMPKLNRQNSKTLVSSQIPGSPQSQLKTLNIQKENFNMEIKLTSKENVRLEVEIEEHSDDDDNDGSKGNLLREDTKNKLKRLGRLYAGEDFSSPIQRTEDKFFAQFDDNEGKNEQPVKSSGRGLRRLADLAEKIKQWDYETSEPEKKDADTEKTKTPKKLTKPPAPQPPVHNPSSPIKSTKGKAPPPPKVASPLREVNSPTKSKPVPNNLDTKSPICSPKKPVDVVKTTPKRIGLDKDVLDRLESQGFTRTDSNSRLVYNYSSPTKTATEATTPSKVKAFESKLEKATASPVLKKQEVSSPSKLSPAKLNLFQSPKSAHSAKDPALLSVSERKALFEKNKGGVLMPKAAFAMAVPLNKDKAVGVAKPVVQSSNKVEVAVATPVVSQAEGIASKMAALLQNKNTISQAQIQSSIKEQKQKDMDLLLNRFNRSKQTDLDKINEDKENGKEAKDDKVIETSHIEVQVDVKDSGAPLAEITNDRRKSPGKRQPDSPKVVEVLGDIKRIKVSPPKAGRLYPSLSDIEAATETENDEDNLSTPHNSSLDESTCESDDPNTSFGREILQAVCKNQTPQKRPVLDESTASDISDVLDDMDDYLDEAMEYCEAVKNNGPTPSKQSRHSPKFKSGTKLTTSFHYKSYTSSNSNLITSPRSPKKSEKSPTKTPKKSMELPSHVVDGDNILPLTHTVSFYRKQQTQASATPVKHIIRQPAIKETESLECDSRQQLREKISNLQEEVSKQHLVIAQASQALNLCSCTPEFMGSTEQVEAEKLLLLATHRRQAMLDEIQRLNVEGTLRPQTKHAEDLPLEKGSLTISNITLPLKKEYVRALAAAGGKGHHVVCLIQCGEQVQTTKLVSTAVTNAKNPEMEIKIPNSVTLHDIYSDFTVKFEVYCLQAQEEVLPHEVKYHINNKKPPSKMTPKKGKQESRLTRPVRESPGGPQTVRSPSFALMGYVVFSIQQITKTNWTLNNTPSMSPLEGTIKMNISCQLAVSIEHRGFLTMFQDISGFGAWHRRWCLLKSNTLSYWKYPDDERKVPPIDTLDLKNCITERVAPVNREICARPHTFLLETERPPSKEDKDTLVVVCKGDKTIVRHLFSADTKEERIEWCAKFNSALKALKMWGNNS